MDFKKLFVNTLCALALSAGFVACSDDEDDNGPHVDPPTNAPIAYILNEGSYGNNNANISLYSPEEGTVTANIYQQINEKPLGDTAQDLITYDGHIYVVLNGSNYIAKLDQGCAELVRKSFTEAEGEPRFITAADGFIYVTTYSHRVLKLDAETLETVGYVSVDSHPEYVAVLNNMLYCSSSGYGMGNTVSEVDLSDFTVTRTFEVVENPNDLVAANGQVYVISWNSYWADYTLQSINPITEVVSAVGAATKMAVSGDLLLLANSVSDWVTFETTTTFASYNTATGAFNESSFLVDAPEELATATIFMMEVNPNNGDIYIGTTDYYSNGDIYRFDSAGNFIAKLDAGGVSPNNMIFLN